MPTACRRKLTIGAYPAVDLGAARRRALEALGDVAGGRDPAVAKQASRAAARAEREAGIDRVERVVEQFIERHAKPTTRDWRETERILVNEVVRRWKGCRLSQITRAHVHEMLDMIVDRGAPIRANRVFAQFRKMCRWALSRGIVGRSPCEGLSAPSVETRRDRVLSDAEIRLAWNAFAVVGWPFGPIGQLLLLAGQRRNEFAGMRWEEVSLDAKLWILPKERSKNRQDHQVPLSDDAVRLLQSLPRIGDAKGFVFTTTGKTPVSGFSRAKAIDRMTMEKATGVQTPWAIHDIRRTVATNLQKLGVRLEVTEAVLGHISGQPRRHNRHLSAPHLERRKAFGARCVGPAA